MKGFNFNLFFFVLVNYRKAAERATSLTRQIPLPRGPPGCVWADSALVSGRSALAEALLPRWAGMAISSSSLCLSCGDCLHGGWVTGTSRFFELHGQSEINLISEKND